MSEKGTSSNSLNQYTSSQTKNLRDKNLKNALISMKYYNNINEKLKAIEIMEK